MSNTFVACCEVGMLDLVSKAFRFCGYEDCVVSLSVWSKNTKYKFSHDDAHSVFLVVK